MTNELDEDLTKAPAAEAVDDEVEGGVGDDEEVADALVEEDWLRAVAGEELLEQAEDLKRAWWITRLRLLFTLYYIKISSTVIQYPFNNNIFLTEG